MPEAVPAFVWVADLVAPGASLLLDEAQSHHVARVCRARAGDLLSLTDGRGGVARGRVAKIAPRVTLEIESTERSPRGSTAVLLCGAPEGQRFDWLVEKLAELGVARVRPIECARRRWASVMVRPDRWRRLAIAALQQSRGRFLLEIESPVSLAAALELEVDRVLAVLADPAGVPPISVALPGSGTTVGVVGPAGGFDQAERSLIQGMGFRAMALSDGRLRTETAALAWAAWWAGGSVGAWEKNGPHLDDRQTRQ
ncbi:MAG: 16S rRNA (uracil(1498)-N(3))-methyltransferase [Candidatus Eisenbacteria bacterium]|uniref:Ribosomal RNA small subunit methyltransferase E n=1 Tax=Eiseniibacteriota bacterium TaxID=2212470 RepID=A0A538U8R6_UNCEI|nr:MAG: 16S rRNA (uracil(1498)-N(3))-methyltransferase [Candidatus Eisenbacteria bacterium]